MFKNGFIKKADILLLVLLLALGVLSIVLTRTDNLSKPQVEISIDGKVYKTVSLEKDQEITIDNEYGKNVVVIKDSKVYVKEANCAGGDCIEMNPISRGGQMIMCLPHKLLISIVEGGSIVDSTSY